MHRSTRSRRTAALVAGGAVTAVLVGAGAAVATAAPATSAPDEPLRCSVGALVGTLPAALRQDLRALRAEPRGERVDERRAIRRKALAGEYGERAEEVVRALVAAREEGPLITRLPAPLRQDLRALHAQPKGERADERRAIRRSALAGHYGDQIQAFAERVRDQVCAG